MRVVLFNVLFFGGTFFTALTALLVSFGPGGQKRVRACLRFQGRWVQGAVRHILKGKIEIRGLEHVSQGGPMILAPKHQSELDVFIPTALYPDLSAIAMAELSRYPLLGPVLRKLDYIMVSVDGPRKSQLAQVVAGARKSYAQGRPILIYPEGELMRLGSRERYKSGVWHIAQDLDAPVIPVAQSLGLIWPQRRWRKHVGQTGVWEFMEPIHPGPDRAAFLAELEHRIEERTMALIREHGDPEIVAEAEHRYRHRLTNSDTPVRGPATEDAASDDPAAARNDDRAAAE